MFQSFLWSAGLSAASFLFYAIYQLSINPLSKVPGPRILSLTQLPWFIHSLSGDLAFWLAELHEHYGPAVRIGPREVSFAATSLQTWRCVYAHRPEFPKSKGGTGLLDPDQGAGLGDVGVGYLVMCNAEVHKRMRSAIEPAFRESALREQEPYFKHHLGKLVSKIHEACVNDGSAQVDMDRYVNYFTFDVVGDLLFGEDFGSLDTLEHDPWVETFFETIRALGVGQMATYYNLTGILSKIMPKEMADAQKLFWKKPKDKVDWRLNNGRKDDRKDWVSYFELQSEKEGRTMDGLTRKELHKNAALFVFAGSETTGTTLASMLFALCTHRQVYEKLIAEIRSKFITLEDIDVSKVGECLYLTQCIQEIMRVRTSAPGTVPRVVSEPGVSIEGFYMPIGTVVGVNPYSTFRSSRNFHHPAVFIPERWATDQSRPSGHEEDRFDVVQAFSMGPRNCIGQRLAQIMLRLALCYLLWSFDFELCDESRHWDEKKVHLIWEKKPLMMQVTPREQ